MSTDLDYYMVELFNNTSNTPMETNLVKVLPDSFASGMMSTCFSTINTPNKVKVTVFDKCGQSSPQPLPVDCSSQENGKNNIISYNNIIL